MVLSVALRIDLTTGRPIVILGTKWPSITSTCSMVAPPARTDSISSASLAKSADNIDGAISNIRLSYLVAANGFAVALSQGLAGGFGRGSPAGRPPGLGLRLADGGWLFLFGFSPGVSDPPSFLFEFEV